MVEIVEKSQISTRVGGLRTWDKERVFEKIEQMVKGLPKEQLIDKIVTFNLKDSLEIIKAGHPEPEKWNNRPDRVITIAKDWIAMFLAEKITQTAVKYKDENYKLMVKQIRASAKKQIIEVPGNLIIEALEQKPKNKNSKKK